MEKVIKVEWCKNWILATFAKLPEFAHGFECNHFWKLAEKSGLWKRGTYGSPMTKAIEELCEIEWVWKADGRTLAYNAFRLKGGR